MAEKRDVNVFVLEYAPSAAKNDCVSFGVVMIEPEESAGRFAEVRFAKDWRRVRCLDPGADVEYLEALEQELQQSLRETGSTSQLLKLLRESLSNTVRVSVTSQVQTENPTEELDLLARQYLEAPPGIARLEPSGRMKIVRRMRDAFEQAGVLALMRSEIPVEPYTRKGDPLKIDLAYRPNGVIKMFQGVSLAASVDAAKVLAFSYPELSQGIRRVEDASLSLTAVVEDNLDRGSEDVGFALATMENSGIRIAVVSEMETYAAEARREFGV